MAAGNLELTRLGQGSGLSPGIHHNVINSELEGVTETFISRVEKGEVKRICLATITETSPAAHNQPMLMSCRDRLQVKRRIKALRLNRGHEGDQ